MKAHTRIFSYSGTFLFKTVIASIRLRYYETVFIKDKLKLNSYKLHVASSVCFKLKEGIGKKWIITSYVRVLL
jgi:hypothetical protein